MADQPSSKRSGNFIRFTSLAFQMIGTIGFFSWLGYFLDQKADSKNPWWTICLSLFGVFVSIYLVIREVIKMSKDNE